MKKEKVVVSRISQYGKILENRFKDAVLAVDGSVVRQVAVDECRAEIATYNKMVDLLKGNPINKYDTRPDSYFVSATVEDIKPIDGNKVFFSAINKEEK